MLSAEILARVLSVKSVSVHQRSPAFAHLNNPESNIYFLLFLMGYIYGENPS